jgi:hypothetical protein
MGMDKSKKDSDKVKANISADSTPSHEQKGYSTNEPAEGSENRDEDRVKWQEEPSKRGTPNLPGQGGLSSDDPAEGREDVGPDYTKPYNPNAQ